MLEIISLTKKFDAFIAVENLSLKIRSGEIYGFLGPNGAGKTTTIKMIATLLKPTSGRVIINGIDAHLCPAEAKRYLAYVPDQPFLYDKLNGREFLLFTARMYDMQEEEATDQLMQVAKLFEVTPWLNRRIEDYSQGMRQRLVLAAAMMHKPKLIVIDEPMVGLDPRGAETLKSQIRLAAQNGAAVFLTTHQLSLASEICTRIGIINSGRLVFDSEMDRLSGDGVESLERKYIELTTSNARNV
jgi:ABC-2 type transport system ATP-binding protein